DVGHARAGNGGTPARGPESPGRPTAPRRGPGAGTMGVVGLRGFRGARVPSGATGVLPAGTALGGRAGGRRERRGAERMRAMRGFVWLALLAGGLIPGPAAAQYFGQNKVQYRTFDFTIIQTEHFEVYYSRREGP